FDNITFHRRESAHGVGYVQAVIFEAAHRDNIGGSAYGGQKAICCSPDLAKLEGCKQGEVIWRPSAENHKWPYVIGVHFRGDDTEATLGTITVSITKTGMYNLYFISCEPKLKGLVMTGKTIWKNPTGYLPGRMAPLMTFYGLMSLAYVLIGLVWFTQYARFWREILQIQNCITLVIALGMLEMTMWYFEYANFNAIGIRSTGITIWAVTFGAVKRTISRVTILVVSMGFGVVRPTLGGITSKVALLGATFFLASELLDLVENVGSINDMSGKARLFLVLPVAILDAFFIIWIFTSLSKTLEKLQARRLLAKLDIYRKFTNALAVAVIVSVAWIGYEDTVQHFAGIKMGTVFDMDMVQECLQIHPGYVLDSPNMAGFVCRCIWAYPYLPGHIVGLYFKATDPFSERWQSAWIVSAFWHILSFALLCIICALWAPSQNSTRYAYSDDVGEEFGEEVTVSLTKSVAMADSYQNSAKLEEKKEVGTDVFNLIDDTEDKRE
ncbi:hypothetical protein KI387_009785, partial [Taxus chinensis]